MSLINAERGDNKLQFMGRKRVYTSEESVNLGNIEAVMAECLPVHRANASAESYLWRYYKGDQPVLYRTKESRPEICNIVVENHAQEAVQFKVGYQFAEPLQYIPRSSEDDDSTGHEGSEDELVNNVRVLNSLCHAVDKASQDRDIFEWMCVCGLGYRMLRAVPQSERGEGDPPFAMYTLDPRSTFVIYGSGYDRKPLAAVWIGSTKDGGEVWNVYTEDAYYVKHALIGDTSYSGWLQKPNPLGICIFEYELNSARQGVFEPALPLLDAMNTIESNRLDGIEQTVQSLLVFDNVDINGETYDEMRERGALKIRSYDGANGKVYTVEQLLDQVQTQTAKDDLYSAFTSIIGMPNNYKSSSSTSDTGTAVMLRDGWTLAESHAKSYELKWKRTEREMLKMLLDICRVQSSERVDLRVRDIDLAFSRRSYENTLVKAQTLTTMLQEDRIDPELAFAYSGLFTDPTAAYLQSKAHYEEVQAENERKAEQMAAQTAQGGGDGSNDHNSAVSKVSAANRQAQQTGVHPAK